MNLARIKCLSQLVCAMCKVQTVNFSKPAEDGKVILHTNNLSLVVEREQFEKAMDRMTVHFPTSIRMHKGRLGWV